VIIDPGQCFGRKVKITPLMCRLLFISKPHLSDITDPLSLSLSVSSSIGESQWELELFALQESNAKLVQALHESNVTVEQWKKQLTAYKEETEKLRERVRKGSRGRGAGGRGQGAGL